MSVDDEPGAPSALISAVDIPLGDTELFDTSEIPNVLAALEDMKDDAASFFITQASIITSAEAAPTTFTTPLYYDSTALTGGLYAWGGSAYVQIGGLIA